MQNIQIVSLPHKKKKANLPIVQLQTAAIGMPVLLDILTSINPA